MEVLVGISTAVPTPSPVPLGGSMTCGASMPCGAGTTVWVGVEGDKNPGEVRILEENLRSKMEQFCFWLYIRTEFVFYNIKDGVPDGSLKAGGLR